MLIKHSLEMSSLLICVVLSSVLHFKEIVSGLFSIGMSQDMYGHRRLSGCPQPPYVHSELKPFPSQHQLG